MHAYLYHALGSFRSLFSHRRTWLKFVMLVLGFMAMTDLVGVSSWCRFWLLDGNGYCSLLQFSRSSAWSLGALAHHWAVFVLAQQQVVYWQGRCVLLGDHTYVSKEGRRMPGVVTLHQESETQSKQSYFQGQCWGALGIVVGSLAAPFCLPLALRLHQGWQHLGHVDEPSPRTETLANRVVLMALAFAIDQDRPSILVLDAFFSVASVFRIAHSVCSVSGKAPFLTLIIRANKELCRLFSSAAPGTRSARSSALLWRYSETDGVLRLPASVFDRLVSAIWSRRNGLDTRSSSALENNRGLDSLCLRRHQPWSARVNV